jgi:hypothetical protein
MASEKLLQEVASYIEDPSPLDERILIEQESLFSTHFKDGKLYRHFPEHCESFADSFLLRMILYLSKEELKEEPVFDVKDVSIDKFVDVSWTTSASFFQGLLRGLVSLKTGKCCCKKRTKGAWRMGLWYCYSQVLKKLGTEKSVLAIPRQAGIFTYLNYKNKGMLLAEMIIISQLVNSVIDKYNAPIDLIKYILLSPQNLTARGQMRHKKPQDKTAIFFPSEIDFLTKTLTPVFDQHWSEAVNAYRNVKDDSTLQRYAVEIQTHNKKLRGQTALADRISASRAAVLFRKGLKGRLNERLASLDLDQYYRFYPSCWGMGMAQLPFVDTNDELSVKVLARRLKAELNSKKDVLLSFLQEWINNLTLVSPKLSSLVNKLLKED